MCLVGLAAGGVTWGLQRFGAWVGDYSNRSASSGETTAAEPGDPTRIVIPSISVDAPMIPLGLDEAGALEPPPGTTEAGWYRDGPEPGEAGTAIVAGHLDSKTGAAVFARLPEVSAGARIDFSSAAGTTSFEVTRVARYPKEGIPDEEVYGHTAMPQLRLITCGGSFDRSTGHYRDNVIVYARRLETA